MHKRTDGFSIIEALVVTGVIALVVVIVGNLLSTIYKLDAASQSKLTAANYTQEPLEIINDLKQSLFACICSSDSCVANTCTRLSDGQSCVLFNGYTSCWTEYPEGLAGETDFYFDNTGASWELKALSGVETISSNPDYTRKVTIENVYRNVNGDIDDSGAPDINTKKVTVTVWNIDRGVVHTTKITTLLTAWENL